MYCKYCALFSDSSKISRLVKVPLTVWTTATVTIPLLDDVLGNLQSRLNFEKGQENVMKGILLLPSSTISESDWDSAVDRFIKGYIDEIPSHYTVEAENYCGSSYGKKNGKKS